MRNFRYVRNLDNEINSFRTEQDWIDYVKICMAENDDNFSITTGEEADDYVKEFCDGLRITND